MSLQLIPVPGTSEEVAKYLYLTPMCFELAIMADGAHECCACFPPSAYRSFTSSKEGLVIYC